MAASQPIPTHGNFQDLTGDSIGQWMVESFAGRNARGQMLWNCHCACGFNATRTVKLGTSLSCGKCQSQPRSTENDDYIRMLILMSCNLTPTGCWEWQYARHTHGYGLMSLRGRVLGVHVISYMLWRGDNPDGLHVLHECDNPPCCNPDHLFLGTQQDNMADMVSKGRQNVGAMRPAAKLTLTDVESIREARGAMKQKDIAARFGISEASVSVILNHKAWKHADPMKEITCQQQ